jgi:hypothetical protein
MQKSDKIKKTLKLNESDKRTLNSYQNFVVEAPKVNPEKKITEQLVKIS